MWSEVWRQREQPEQRFHNHSGIFPAVQYIVCTSTYFEEAACVSARDNVPHRDHILLLGVAEQGETGIDPRETFNLARFKLKFRAVLLHSTFSKGP